MRAFEASRAKPEEKLRVAYVPGLGRMIGTRTEATHVYVTENKAGSYNYERIRVDPGVLRTLDEDQSLFHIVNVVARPGVSLFSTHLEHSHYVPHTARNRDFQHHIIVWEEMPFLLISIPLRDRGLVDASAAFAGLRLVDVVPAVIHGGDPPRTCFFPMTSPRVWYTESDSRSAVVQEHRFKGANDPAWAAWAEEEEKKIVEGSRERFQRQYGFTGTIETPVYGDGA